MHRRFQSVCPLLICALLFVGTAPRARAEEPPETAIRKVLSTQVDAWNKGDLTAFVEGYAEDCVFVGSSTVTGRSAVLARYQKRYGSREAMGRLSFSELEVRLIDSRVAIVLGRFALERSKEGGGPASGIFSLVFHLNGDRWEIVLDYTS
jgi:uncharacterized protein (TIGR02246 family)